MHYLFLQTAKKIIESTVDDVNLLASVVSADI